MNLRGNFESSEKVGKSNFIKHYLLADTIVKYLKKKFMIFMTCKLRFIISILVKFFGSKINIGDVSKNIHRLIDVLYANSLLSSFYN